MVAEDFTLAVRASNGLRSRLGHGLLAHCVLLATTATHTRHGASVRAFSLSVLPVKPVSENLM